MSAGTGTGTGADDFILVEPDALPAEACAEIVERMRVAPGLGPGRTGGGLFPELKSSLDLDIEGREEWSAVRRLINSAMIAGLRRYLRQWPQALIAPLMLELPGSDGKPRRLTASDVESMADDTLNSLIVRCFRPGGINLQWYRDGEGGYPYWHCELYPRDPAAETLHRHLLWTLYLNDGFEEGETEFLAQRRKITPKTGSLLFAPAGFTHTHRGNRPRGGDKFIATSWVLFRPAAQLYANR